MGLIEKAKPLGPLLVGLGGFGVLVSLGFWQLDRLSWKEELIASVQERMSAAPIPLPQQIDPQALDYRSISVSGKFDPEARINFLSSKKLHGPGYDLITPFETADGRRILVDRGYVPMKDQATIIPPEGTVDLTGLLRWPDDKNSFVPDPDLTRMEWYSRDVASMAEALGTEPLLLVAEQTSEKGWPAPRPQRITLPNHHLQYALTWFGLAAAWIIMSVLWAWGPSKRPR